MLAQLLLCKAVSGASATTATTLVVTAAAAAAKSLHLFSSMDSCQDVYAEIKASDGVFKYYCNGQWLQSSSGKSVPVICPTTQESVFSVQGGCLRVDWMCV